MDRSLSVRWIYSLEAIAGSLLVRTKLLFRLRSLFLRCAAEILALDSSTVQLVGAHDSASCAAWVGICLYLVGGLKSACAWDDACLCCSAAFLAFLTLEKMDIIVLGRDEVLKLAVGGQAPVK